MDDVEPVDGDRGVGEALGQRRQEGRRHIADDLGNPGRLAAVGQHEAAERRHTCLALAGGDEDHRLVLTVHVDEHGDVVVAALGRGLVQPDRAHPAEIEPGNGPAYIVLDDPPQPFVGDADAAQLQAPERAFLGGYEAGISVAAETRLLYVVLLQASSPATPAVASAEMTFCLGQSLGPIDLVRGGYLE